MKNRFINNFPFVFRRARYNAYKYDSIKIVYSFSDIPSDTARDIYIVTGGGVRKWAVFKCPDNCGKRIEVNLMKSRYPSWRLIIKRKKASLFPSIVVNECRSHFWLKQNIAISTSEN